MRTWRWVGAGVLALGALSAGRAQVPGVPGAAPPAGVPGAAAAPAAAGAPAAPAAAPKNLWSFLCPTPEQLAAKKQKFCACGLGQLINSMLLPMSAMSGGLLKPICPGPNAANAADLAKDPASPQGAAARIKAEEAQAKARAAAVRYLATVNCRYYPEAEAALIAALRGDKNECVRIEAARALGSGCCCTRRTIAALTIAVNGSTKDDNPAERSECVKALAYLALQRCLASYKDVAPVKPPEPPEPVVPKPKGEGVQVASYYARAEAEGDRVIREAREAVARGLNVSQETIARLTGQHNLLGVVSQAAKPVPAPPQAVATLTTREPPRLPEPPAVAKPVASPGQDRAQAGTRSLMQIFREARR